MNDMALQAVRSLSIHADYRCRHSGACCTADWDVPVEAARLPVARRSVQIGASAHGSAVPRTGALRGRARPSGRRRRHAGAQPRRRVRVLRARVAAVRRAPGARPRGAARHLPPLPAPGRPRQPRHVRQPVALLPDRGGVAVSRRRRPDDRVVAAGVSAGRLRRPDGHRRRAAAAAAAGRGDGSRRLRPMGGAHGAPVRRCGDAGIGVGDARARRRACCAGGRRTDRRWPISSMRCQTRSSRPRRRPRLPRALPTTRRRWRRCRTICGPSPTSTTSRRPSRASAAPAWGEWSTPLRRYLAAKAFASWTAYQGRGLSTIVRGLQVALALVRVEAARACRDARRPLDRELLLEAFREADFILNHLAVGEDLALEWSKAEAR